MRQLVLPVGAAVFVLAALAAVVAAARQTGSGDAPPTPGAMQLPRIAAYATFTVERVEPGRLVVSGGSVSELPVGAETRAWRLEPADADAVQTGAAIAIIGVPNEVRNAAIRAIIVGDPGSPGPAGPFGGHEALGERFALPMVVGTVVRVEEGRAVIRTGAGEATAWPGEGAPVFRVREVEVDDIRPGDRVGVLLDRDGRPDPGRGLLVMRGE
ncbi:hypothetical protein A9A59_1472 [Tepidiforma thermophila]|uniref:DUF5666 domain-containing protein n=1 Tax=Tepidiforma thermophila (strain KCTC 52669 / CGMCC 1.13589 / G233) TaxID=2761530 RepID=A0A2A9HE09_TEPT2|nr:hypothetical protein A9A59_1472 [Tepidiforma thermophila]